MRVHITGIDGYEGFALGQWLAHKGMTVRGIDNESRRQWVHDLHGGSIVPIGTFEQRQARCNRESLRLESGDVIDYTHLREWLQGADVVVHLAEQPSAPYSMKDVWHANRTLSNNVQGTAILLAAMRESCPKAHLIWVSTMGEYGTPGIPIPEGVFPDQSFWNEYDLNGDLSQSPAITGLPFPRCPGSIYHASKVASGVLVDMACRLWGIQATVLYQGVVFGTQVGLPDEQPTRFDVDEAFGTVLNRFCAQALLGRPLTVYGAGGQTRGFISLANVCRSIQYVIRAGAPEKIHHINQVDRFISIQNLAHATQMAAKQLGIDVRIDHIPNPRKEAEEHSYEVSTDYMLNMPDIVINPLPTALEGIMVDLFPHCRRLERYQAAIAPHTRW